MMRDYIKGFATATLVVTMAAIMIARTSSIPPPCDRVCCVEDWTKGKTADQLHAALDLQDSIQAEMFAILEKAKRLTTHTCPDTVYVFPGSDIVAPYEISKIIWEQRANAVWSEDTAHKAVGDLPRLIDTTQRIAIHVIDCPHIICKKSRMGNLIIDTCFHDTHTCEAAQ